MVLLRRYVNDEFNYGDLPRSALFVKDKGKLLAKRIAR